MLQTRFPDPASTPELPSRVKAVLTVDGQVLVLRKPSGEWDLPGGRRDPCELPEATLARELAEELGMIPPGLEFLQLAWRLRGAKPPVRVAFFGCTLGHRHWLDDLCLSAEHQEAQLVGLRELPRLTMPPVYAQVAVAWLTAQPIWR